MRRKIFPTWTPPAPAPKPSESNPQALSERSAVFGIDVDVDVDVDADVDCRGDPREDLRLRVGFDSPAADGTPPYSVWRAQGVASNQASGTVIVQTLSATCT